MAILFFVFLGIRTAVLHQPNKGEIGKELMNDPFLVLDENAKFIVDREMVEIAKAFANSRIRVEGNTDDVGSAATNLALSRKRAQAVVDYLVTVHSMNRNRFVVIGNGPNKPVSNNDTEEGKAKNRRTDFELISE